MKYLNDLKTFIQHFPGYCIQTFDDKPEKRQDLVKFGKAEDFTFEALSKLNKQGAGIYFTPNAFWDKPRKKENCQQVNAWFIDMDTGTKDEQLNKLFESPLDPSSIVETKNGHHAYWLAEDAKTQNFEKIVIRLIDYFGSDKACKDISRVLRLPAFFHQKDEPFMIGMIYINPDLKYTEAQMLKAFPEKVKKAVDWNHLGGLDNRMMLEKLSGSSLVNNETFTFRKRTTGGEYIDVNGKPADAWIDNKGMIGSGKGGAPTWIQWCEYYGKSKSEILKYIQLNHPEHIQEIDYTSLRPTETKQLKEVIAKQKTPFTWGTPNLDKAITPIDNHHLIMVVGETGAGKTAWTFDLAIKNANIGHKVLYLSLEMSGDKLIERLARAHAGITKDQWRDKKLISERQLGAYEKKIKFLKEIENLEILGFGKLLPTTDNIKKIIAQVSPGLVLVDNMDLIDIGQAKNEYVAQNAISKDFMDYTNSKRIPIIILHHFNKGSSKNRGLDSVRGSGKITHNADTVLICKRDELEKDSTGIEKAEFHVIQKKDRDFGQLSSTCIYFNSGEFDDTYKMQI